MYSSSSTSEPGDGPKRRTALQEKLQARHESALANFRAATTAMNARCDEEQLHTVAELKEYLASSHAQTAALLEEEEDGLSRHETALAAYAARMGDGGADETGSTASAGDVLSPFVDRFHPIHSAADPTAGATESLSLMRAERLRLLQRSAEVRQLYTARAEAVERSKALLEASEKERCVCIQESLRALMLALAKVSYCSVTASHVLAQRTLHSVNAQIALNFTGMQTLLSRLGQREVLKHRVYVSRIAAALARSRRCMEESSLWWARTMLQTAAFRRPVNRMDILERINGVSARARRNGVTFIDGLSAVVLSLRKAFDDSPAIGGPATTGELPAAVSSTQPPRVRCGGTTTTGWLRSYCVDEQSDPFPGGCDGVVDEWRMKVNVLLRNTLVDCQAAAAQVVDTERQRQDAVRVVRRSLTETLVWLYSPLVEEHTLLAAASLQQDGGSSSSISMNVEDVLLPFTEPDRELAASAKEKAERLLDPVDRLIKAEADWLSTTVEKGLLRSFTHFEEALLSAAASVLRWFEKMTSVLVVSSRGVLGPIRLFHVRRCEEARDYDDSMALREAAYDELCARLAKASTVKAAENLFAEGLRALNDIAGVYASRQRQTAADLEEATAAVQASTAACTDGLLRTLGLESTAKTQARLEAARQERIAAMLAERMHETSAVSKNGSTSNVRRGSADSDAGSGKMEAMLLAQLAEETPLEEVDYPQLITASGAAFNVVGPFDIVADAPRAVDKADTGVKNSVAPHPPVITSKDALKSKRSFRQPQPTPPSTAANATPAMAVTTAAPHTCAAPEEFVAVYTPMLEDTLLSPEENFLADATVGAWKVLLRAEVLEWVVALSSSADSGMREYCAVVCAESERATSELLRRHRRRPATLQADRFEARVRELDGEVHSSERRCGRVRERLTKLCESWESFVHDPAEMQSAVETSNDLKCLEEQAVVAGSLGALQAQRRRHEKLCAQYVDSLVQATGAALASFDRSRASLEDECRRCLAERVAALGQQGASTDEAAAQAAETDSVCVQLRGVLAQLEETGADVHAKAEKQLAERRAAAEASKAAYTAVYEQNAAELQLFAAIQEVLSWLKMQVHTLQATSAAEEEALAAKVHAVEAALVKPLAQPTLSNAVRQLLKSPVAASATSSLSTTELTPDARLLLASQLEARQREARAQLQRDIRGCSLAQLFELLDKLREPLYVRAATLDALAVSVELVRLAPEHFIMPVETAGREAGASVGATGSQSSRSGTGANSGRKNRRVSNGSSRAASSARGGASSSARAKTAALPAVESARVQFGGWAAQAKERVTRLVSEHMAAHPAPLRRALLSSEGHEAASESADAGVEGGGKETGSLQAVLARLVDPVCAAQLQRVDVLVVQAKKVFYKQVQQLYSVIVALPSFAAASLHALASSATEGRLASVLTAFDRFAAQSIALREGHRRNVKVSAASSKEGAAALARLAASETSRQGIAAEVTGNCWGLALREVQDEADQHAARCYTSMLTLFDLLRGLVTPEQLRAFEWEDGDAHHRGLKHLLRMRQRKEANESAAEAALANGALAGKRERRLQETLPLPKQQQQQQQTGDADASATAKDSADGALLSPARLHSSTTYPGLPLLRVKPLDAFNAAHPTLTVAPLGLVYSYFDGLREAEAQVAKNLSAAASSSTSAQSASSGRRVAPSKRRSVDQASAYGSETGRLVTPPLQAPATAVHQDIVLRVTEAVESFNAAARGVAGSIDSAFQAWTDQENTWCATWSALIEKLRPPAPAQGTESAAAVATSPSSSRASRAARSPAHSRDGSKRR